MPRNLTYVSKEEMPWFNELVKLDFDMPILDLKVIRGVESKFKMLDFTHNITKWDEEDMQIQLKFKKAKDVSYGSELE